MKTWVFDLGDTLIEYEGLPLSWVPYYPEALRRLGQFLGFAPRFEQVEIAARVLTSYNTRLNPREHEVKFAQILQEICAVWRIGEPDDLLGAARAYFSPFRQRLRCFPETKRVLATLKSQSRLGIFTDVPYGMPKPLVENDLREAGLEGIFEIVVSSEEVGFRKPSPLTLEFVSRKLGVSPSELAYVGNEQKDVAAAKAFGCEAILIDRIGKSPSWGQDRRITTLEQLLDRDCRD